MLCWNVDFSPKTSVEKITIVYTIIYIYIYFFFIL
jgi:hypothetical protein